MTKPSEIFVTPTTILDASEIFSTDVNSESFKHFLVKLTQVTNNISDVLNTKESGIYDTRESVTGKLYYPTGESDSSMSLKPVWRPGRRTVVVFGALPNATTKSVAHGINVTSAFTLIDICGAGSDKTAKTYVPISSLNVSMDATNINITTTSNMSSYTSTDVVIEYLTY